MRIIKADAMGMCFGVRDALKIAEDINEPTNVSVFGELVHNEEVLDHMTKRGFEIMAESNREAIPTRDSVLITAHGVSDADRTRLANAGKRLIDTTCPLVRRVHQAAQNLERGGCFVVVIGRKGHVEVIGITGDLSRYAIVESPTDVIRWPHNKIGVVEQSTTPPAHADAMLALIRRRNAGSDIRHVRTICRPTFDRQAAMERLLDEADAVIVVGGSNSNNTRALAQRAESRGIPARHIQSADDLDPVWLGQFETIGLTAGTSTPPDIIAKVEYRLGAIAESVNRIKQHALNTTH